jgi:hypothetical protein
MIEGRQRYRGADSQALRTRCDVRAHHVYRGADAVGAEVMFRQPDCVVAASLHHIDALEGALVHGLERYAFARPAEELQHGELHEGTSAATRGHEKGNQETLRW